MKSIYLTFLFNSAKK